MPIGVFGSAFDPPTYGHLDVIQQAANHFEQIILVPSAIHAFAKSMQPLRLRKKMLTYFIAEAHLPCTLLIDWIEAQLQAKSPKQPVYTYTVMKALEKNYPNEALSFIRGPDNAEPQVWQRFYRYQDIEQRWGIFTAKQNLAIRSSEVRALLQQPTQLNRAKLEQKIPKGLAQYLLDSGCYGQ